VGRQDRRGEEKQGERAEVEVEVEVETVEVEVEVEEVEEGGLARGCPLSLTLTKRF
jgi:hypothetical protein